MLAAMTLNTTFMLIYGKDIGVSCWKRDVRCSSVKIHRSDIWLGIAVDGALSCLVKRLGYRFNVCGKQLLVVLASCR